MQTLIMMMMQMKGPGTLQLFHVTTAYAILLLATRSDAQRFSLLPPARQCPKYDPLPVNNQRDIEQCRREVALARDFKDPNADKRTNQIIVENGYILRTYNVTSSDGYILSLSRITGGERSPPRENKPAVLLQHGLSSSSDSWFALPSNKNLAFKLADTGYDVWLTNQRGSDMSQGHVRLDKDVHIQYWDFSFHEMGTIDLKLYIDLMLNETGQDKIFYVGHSQGGTVYLVGTSEIPELNDKIEAAFLMAPAVYLGGAYMPTFTALLPVLYTPLQDLIYGIFRGRFEQRDPRILSTLLGLQPHQICATRAFQCGLCDTYVFSLYDFNPSQMNYTNLPNLFKIFNAGNLKSYIHFGQNILSCQFRKYDYGPSENRRRYGTSNPPAYNLQNSRAPLHIFWAEQDSFISPPDIQTLVRQLNSSALRGVHRIEDDTFDHVDFVIARDADTLVFNGLIDMMNTYLPS